VWAARPGSARTWVFALAASLALAGCGGGDDGGTVEGAPPDAPDTIELRSGAFEEGGTIPVLYSCDGADLSPPISWSRVPKGARSLALLVEDPDASGGKTFVHWSVFGVRPDVDRIDEGSLPARALHGKNSFGKEFYTGPCPPDGDQPHRYVFALYALRARPDLEQGASPGDVRSAVEENALARGLLTGTFGR